MIIYVYTRGSNDEYGSCVGFTGVKMSKYQQVMIDCTSGFEDPPSDGDGSITSCLTLIYIIVECFLKVPCELYLNT